MLACDVGLMKGLEELISLTMEPLLTPLVERLVSLLEGLNVQTRSAPPHNTGHRTVSAVAVVVNNMVTALDKEKHCAALLLIFGGL